MAKEKIAVLGAGVGAMTAVFEITEQPGWQDKYDITVYQLGWRIGGKGASGRNLSCAGRIQEHGLHVWMGFYENAFDVIRRAYDYCRENNLTPGTPFPNHIDAFSKMCLAPVMEQVQGRWQAWPLYWTPNDDIPGRSNPTDDRPPVDGTPWGYARGILGFMRAHFDRVTDGEPILQGIIDNLVDDLMALDEHKTGDPKRDTLLHRAVNLVESLSPHPAEHDPSHHELLLDSLRRFFDKLLAALEEHLEANDALRHLVIIFDTALGFIHGIIHDGIIHKGFSVIEDENFVDWLARHGCRYAHSPLTRGMYDGAFAYEAGDPSRPRAAAGSILHGSLRLMFTYRGSFMWWMNAGMGDTIFTPIYKALVHRGVRFEFFRRITRLVPQDNAVASIDMDVQAHVRPDLQTYDPFVNVKGLLCWPSEPLYEQLVEAEPLQDPVHVNRDLESWWNDLPTFGKLTLTRGKDFDHVILGISLGALPYICKEFPAADKTGAWQGMFDNVKVVRTQAFQLWLRKTKEELGWNPPEHPEAPVLCSYLEPFDTWGDETHLLPREDWSPSDNVRQNPYFCNAAPDDPAQPGFSDASYPSRQLARTRDNAVRFLNNGVAALWPNALRPEGGFDWTLLVNPGGIEPPINSQWVRINIDPSELYVLTVPGSTKYRLASWDSRFENLILAGDWTLTDVNLGCVEAAVQSGKMASYALTGGPDYVYGAFRKKIPMKDAPMY